MTTAEFAASLIQVFEGLKLTAYKDSGGILTIGFGHTGADVHEGMTITQEQADAFFEQDTKALLEATADRPLLEAAALVSFGYNCGLSAMKKVMAGTSELTSYCHDAKGNVLPGLLSRRQLENNLILISKIPT